MPPIMEQLKLRTQAQHANLERKLDILLHMRSRASYRRLLAQLWGVYAPLERRLAELDGWGELDFDLAARLKLPLLARDLHMLGMADHERAAIPICEAIPELANLAQALGCLYVLEGATLGGQIISRHLEQNLGVTRSTGGAFFASYGARVGPMWRAFGAAAQAYAADEYRANAMIGTARATFETFERWFGDTTRV